MILPTLITVLFTHILSFTVLTYLWKKSESLFRKRHLCQFFLRFFLDTIDIDLANESGKRQQIKTKVESKAV